MHHWILLSVAIASEVIATSYLKAAEGFSRLGPSIVVFIGYLLSIYFLSLTLKTIPVGVAYGIWSGVGLISISLIGWLFLGQSLDMAAVIGLSLIVTGVSIIYIFSRTVPH